MPCVIMPNAILLSVVAPFKCHSQILDLVVSGVQWQTHQYSTWQDIYSFGNPAISQEHWLQIYSPLSSFDHLVSWLKTTVLAPSPTLTWRPPGLYNKASLWRQLILTPLFLTQTSRVWKEPSFELGIFYTRCIVNNVNVSMVNFNFVYI